MRTQSSERLTVEKLPVGDELNTILAFVEGRIDAKELERRLHANPDGFEQVLTRDSGWPAEYLEQGVYRSLVQQDFDHIADVLNVQGALQDYLGRSGIAYVATKAYSKYFDLLLSAQPSWLDVIESDYFRKEVLPKAEDRTGSELKTWIRQQLLERFRFSKKPPRWIQNPDWPINENGPLVFLGQVTVDGYFHDDAAVYVFYDATNGACDTVLQVA